MLELSPVVVVIIMFSAVLVGILIGYPLAFSVGAVTLIVGFGIYGNYIIPLIVQRVYLLVTSYVLVAGVGFIFMGVMLERSGIADRLYQTLYLILGGLRGGLAITTVVLGTILATCVGIIGASISMLTLLALPAMLKRGYDKSIASGAICAGGCLGILIPPSIMLVIYGPMANISVGRLFMAAFLPGLLLSVLYCSYLWLRCSLQPQLAPPAPVKEREASFIKKLTLLLTSIVPISIIILSVLGVIFLGIAPPTEAAAIGAVAATLLTICYRRFSFSLLLDAATRTMRISCFVLLIGAMCYAFVGVFLAAGAGQAMQELIMGVPGGHWGSFAVVMLIFFILGIFVDVLGILFMMIPIISPLAPALGFDPLWFAMMIIVNLQMAMLTPPVAAALFYILGIADPKLELKIDDVTRGVLPFVLLIMLALGLLTAFPQIILWLPAQMITGW